MLKDEIAGQPQTDLVQEITRLQQEHEAVSQQLKQLIKTESKLYAYQEKLDVQVKEYKGLYELSKKFNVTFDVPKLFENTIDYVIHRLEYERVVIFHQIENSGVYAVRALDGYYNEEERNKITELTINQDDSILAPFLAGVEYLICKADTEQELLAQYRVKLLMNEYLIYPLGSLSRPIAILAVGNSVENAAFYRRVIESEDALLGMGNLAGLLASSLENKTFYASMKKAKDELQKAHDELETRVRQRTSELSAVNEQLYQRQLETSVLYQVSSVISRSIHMDELIREVLNTIAGLELFNIDKGGIFIVEGDRMKMVGNVGHSDAFLKLHDDMRVGDCLCGLVAQTGEILISADSSKDSRHTIVDSCTAPHGHLIVPLKTKDRVEGVLDLYMPIDAKVEDDQIKLLLAIGNQMGIAIENVKLYEQAKALSLHDPLTGLWNHEEILRILKQQLDRAEREGSFVGAIMADLDYFKKVNDTYGHQAGDEVLRSTANRMTSALRPYDAIGRYGGEEFMVVLSGCGKPCIAEIAERLRKSVADEGIETPGGRIQITLSLGTAVSGKEWRPDVASLIHAADSALYLAKKNGRNRVEIAQ